MGDYGFHEAVDCLVGHVSVVDACPLYVRLPNGEFRGLGRRVQEVVYHFLYREYGWTPEYLCWLAESGRVHRVVFQHACCKYYVGG